MSEKMDRQLVGAFDHFCLRYLHSVMPGELSNVHETVIGFFERRLLELAMRECNGNQLAASRLLGIHRNTLRRKLQYYEKLLGS